MKGFVIACVLIWALGAGIAIVQAGQPLLLIGLVGVASYALRGVVVE